jgi:hypothetical protein
MTPCELVFRDAVRDAGALGAMALDGATRNLIAGHGHDGLISPALLDLLLGSVRPSGALTRACGGPPASAARQLLVVTPSRATYGAVLAAGELVVVATPAGMSVALGWALVRRLSAALEER